MLTSIHECIEQLVEAIREYSRSQKRLWQRIPLLALKANGITGFSDQLSRSYHQGAWALKSSAESGRYTIYVDLATGELIDAHLFHHKKECVPARISDILRIAAHLEELDAQSIIRQLNGQTLEPYPSYYKADTQDAWRKGTQNELKLQSLFTAEQRKFIADPGFINM
ncbi:MAG: hypothetical protein Q7R79_04110 [bacterium]|nr:hypothetical protein [bacterium]